MTAQAANTIHTRYETGDEYAAAVKTIRDAIAAATAEMTNAGVDPGRVREVLGMICGRECFEVHKRMTIEDDVTIVPRAGWMEITMRIRLGRTVDVPDAGAPTHDWAATMGSCRAQHPDNPVLALGKVVSDYLVILAEDLSVLED